MTTNPSEKKPLPSRRKAREWVLQTLYQSDFLHVDVKEAVFHLPQPFDTMNLDLEYFNSLIEGIGIDKQEIDDWIVRTSENWDMERVSVVDRNILRLGIYELMRRMDIPMKVVINEALELSKRFGGESSSRFINGVLDKVAGNVRKQEVEHFRRQRSGEWKG